MGSSLDIGQIILMRTMVPSSVLNKYDGKRETNDSEEGCAEARLDVRLTCLSSR